MSDVRPIFGNRVDDKPIAATALGLILKWVQEGRPGYWFWALETIARETPVTKEMAGRPREMKAAWIRWGRQNGLVQESAPQSRDPRESRTGADC